MSGTAFAGAAAAVGAPRSQMGIATTCYLTAWRPKDTLEFFRHCNELGAGGIQASLAGLDAAGLKQLREQAENAGMYIEARGGLPRAGVEAFEKNVMAAKEVGALCIRTACLSGRRYETFSSLADWRKFVSDSEAAIARAIPILEKLRVRMALENH